MTLWLTRQANGLYMLTAKKPVWAPVDGLQANDAYIAVGEPVGLRNICPLILKVFAIAPIMRGHSIEVELTGAALEAGH